jgi:endoglucanase
LALAALFSKQPAHADGFLHTRGEDIVDESGQKIILRGVGLGNWLLPEGYMWRFGSAGDRPRRIEKIVSDLIGQESADKFWHEYRRNYIAEADIKRIAELGFNSVRAVLNARLFLSEDEKPIYLDEGFELLDRLVQQCKANGVYVIIDMHAAPGGQTGTNIDDSANGQPALFDNPQNQDRLVDLWVKIATRYKDEPAVAAYDLLNEPLPQRTGAEKKYKSQLEPLYQRITKAIRAVDPRHMITVEGADWANDWSVFTEPFDSNLLYQFHYYCWDNPTQLKSIGRYLEKRKRLGAPIWGGETGERDDAIYWATTQMFEANNIGWSFWPWKKMLAGNGPYSIKQPDGWQAIVAVSRGDTSAKPSAEAAQKAFDQLLQNIRLENCTYHPDVIAALFHRVPGKVEAENYGHEGENRSYSVKDADQNAKLYRKSEPVQVETTESVDRRGSGQAIVLNAGEWTAYDINSLDAQTYKVTVKVKTAQSPAAIRLSINDDATSSQATTISNDGWQELQLPDVKLVKGANHVKLAVEQGTLSVDWLNFQ